MIGDGMEQAVIYGSVVGGRMIGSCSSSGVGCCQPSRYIETVQRERCRSIYIESREREMRAKREEKIGFVCFIDIWKGQSWHAK